MSSTTLGAPLDTVPQQARDTPRMVGVAWALLVVNTLGSQGSNTILAIPRPVAQMVTMGSLLLAFTLALLLNPRVRIKPSAYLLLLSLLLVVSVVSSARLEAGYGALFRCLRLALFVATLWLLTRWWDDAATFVRNHLKVMIGVLLTVAAGLVVAPGAAMPDDNDGRLGGALWPIPPPQVGLYGAVVAGLFIVLWLGKRTDTHTLLLIAGPAIGLLLLSHTRTALAGFAAGLVVASLSLVSTSGRARRTLLWGTAVATVVMGLFGSAVVAWLQRGQSAENLATLTGRQKVWDALLAAPRTTYEQLFGIGLSDRSFGGLPIDSAWLAIYHEQGLIGLAVVAAFICTLAVGLMLRPPSIERACAIFLIVYCLAASYTEVGLGDASPYLLNLTVAAALIHRSAPRFGHTAQRRPMTRAATGRTGE